jgi:hypothetical protein
MKYAELKFDLPSGGRFYAAWPQGVAADDIAMAKAMVNSNLNLWGEHARAVEAGEAEYASWAHVSGVEDTK